MVGMGRVNGVWHFYENGVCELALMLVSELVRLIPLLLAGGHIFPSAERAC